MPEIAAIILTGGESRRMGRSKADLPFGGETLLQRSARLVGSATSPVVVSAGPTQSLPDLPAGVIVARDPERGLGPLQGFATGLAATPSTSEYVYLTAVDAPFFSAAWFAFLAEQIGDHDATFLTAAGFTRPIPALFRASAARAAAATLLASGTRRLTSILTTVRSKPLSEDQLRQVDPGLRTLVNINSPDDYERALGLLAEGPVNPANDGDFPGRVREPNV